MDTSTSELTVTTPMPFDDVSLDDRFTRKRGRVLLSGMQALVRLTMMQRQRDLKAGLNTAGFVSGYRGSPLAGLDHEFERAKRHLATSHVVFRPGVNEDLAATAVWGSQQLGLYPGARYDGVFSMWYGKGPGVDRSLDVIRHANAAGTSKTGGALLLVGDDHGAISSTVPHQSEHNLISAMVPILSPGGLSDFLDYGLLGWAMSRYAGIWVGFKCQTDIVESTANLDIDPDALQIRYPETDDGSDVSLRWPDGALAMERRLMDNKIDRVLAFARANHIDQVRIDTPNARLGIIASGKAWLDLTAGLDALGIDAAKAAALGLRVYKVGMVWPLEPVGITRFVEGLERVLVVEEKRGVIEDQIKTLLFNQPDDRRPHIIGKQDKNGGVLLPAWGEIDPGLVAGAIIKLLDTDDTTLLAAAAQISRRSDKVALAPSPLVREAYFCSGCPHSISTKLPDGSRASTGIGCHMMIVGLPERNTGTFSQMGGEGVAWTGMAPFTDEKHIFVNMGDGTYFHSGLLAIRAAVSAGVNATYKILYNDAVAMTGGQVHDGPLTVRNIVDQVLAEGVRSVAVVAEQPERWQGKLPSGVTLDGRDDLDGVQQRLRDVEGITVVVFDQVCAAEKRRRRKKGTFPVSESRAFINELVCEGCGDCSAVSNCISVEPLDTDFGTKRTINQSSCNTDLSCIKGFCPSFVTVTGGKLRRGKAVATTENLFDALPLPIPADIVGHYNILMTGIGGTGVITVGAVVAQAAQLDGLGVLQLDQLGLAQKNGAVLTHLRLAPSPSRDMSARIPKGQADVVLGFDMVVSASADALSVTDAGRTKAVINSHLAPTAAFVKNNKIDFGKKSSTDAIERAMGQNAQFLETSDLATALMGDAIAGNMFMLGYAFQQGLIPVSLAALVKAIELNGVAIKMNLTALSWGRLLAVDPDAVMAAAGAGPKPVATPIERLARYEAFLTDYQDAGYAAKFRRLVDLAETAESRLGLAGKGFAAAVASGAFKLMAYKDEYEVARLQLAPSVAARLDQTFEGAYTLKYHIAPPLLTRKDPRTGHPKKIALGSWAKPLFQILAASKRLRGTAIDPFGWTAERRLERQLIVDYFALIEKLSAELDHDNHAIATELAGLVMDIKGYGHIKLATIERWRARQTKLIERLEHPALALAS